MGKFAKASTQALSVVKAMQKNKIICSLGTARNYTAALTRVAEFAKDERIEGGLRGMTPDSINSYLEQRAEVVGQKQLDMERQSAQAMLRHVTQKLEKDASLVVMKSDHKQILTCRSYTKEQVSIVSNAQREKNALSTQIAHLAGLRAHELLTIRRIEERAVSERGKPIDSKFRERTGEIYSVKGKGGLIREILIPTEIAQRLEEKRLDSPIRVTDREIHYAQYYNIEGGKNWSSSFTQASTRAMGWTGGAHGLRHSYAQERMDELQKSGLERSLALKTVSEELGHFRPDITEIYLR